MQEINEKHFSKVTDRLNELLEYQHVAKWSGVAIDLKEAYIMSPLIAEHNPKDRSNLIFSVEWLEDFFNFLSELLNAEPTAAATKPTAPAVHLKERVTAGNSLSRKIKSYVIEQFQAHPEMDKQVYTTDALNVFVIDGKISDNAGITVAAGLLSVTVTYGNEGQPVFEFKREHYMVNPVQGAYVYGDSFAIHQDKPGAEPAADPVAIQAAIDSEARLGEIPRSDTGTVRDTVRVFKYVADTFYCLIDYRWRPVVEQAVIIYAGIKFVHELKALPAGTIVSY